MTIATCFVNKVLLKHSYIDNLLSTAVFTLCWQSEIVVTKTVWPIKPIIFSIWPFIEDVHWSLLCVNHVHQPLCYHVHQPLGMGFLEKGVTLNPVALCS